MRLRTPGQENPESEMSRIAGKGNSGRLAYIKI